MRSTILRLPLIVALCTWLVAAVVGCRAPECQQMQECCEAVEGEPGVGGACGDLAEGVRDPDTCRSILKTVRAMYEQREKERPPSCQAR